MNPSATLLGSSSDEQKIIDRAIASAEIVDILKAAGIKTADISILSDEFLLEVAGMERKNLALEALRKLLNGEIKSRARTNVVESRAFSERLEAAVARYHAGALSALEMIQELIDLAKDLKAAEARGEESGLTPEELAFYDALAEHEKIRERIASLTAREREVLALMTQGKPNKVMAAVLGVSQRTVEIHRARVMEKSGATSLAQLVRMIMDLQAKQADK